MNQVVTDIKGVLSFLKGQGLEVEKLSWNDIKDISPKFSLLTERFVQEINQPMDFDLSEKFEIPILYADGIRLFETADADHKMAAYFKCIMNFVIMHTADWYAHEQGLHPDVREELKNSVHVKFLQQHHIVDRICSDIMPQCIH